MKKVLSLVAVVLFAIAVAGCSKDSKSESSANGNATNGHAASGNVTNANGAAGSGEKPQVSVPSQAIAQESTPIDHGNRNKPYVALTFDSNMTDAMLKELDTGKVKSFNNTKVIDELIEKKVPATIFLAGKWVERYPDSTKRIADNPQFELASHSYAHLGFRDNCYGLGKIKPQDMAADVEHSEKLLRQYSDHVSRYFRFPGLCWDATAMNAIAPTGVVTIGGDLGSGDAFGTNVNAIVENTLNNTKNGSIVVMHITGGNTAPLSAEALPRIVDGLRAKGFNLVTVSDLLAQ